ncbi:pyridoxamine 5'-phosphate oxidase family protein [Azorhizobium caulinodans]|uniref:Pyridoxamine 5'-phosphate oxidase-related protein n=1 Tax=Azorhizobium caulinodans (strain ATCC 43989 / DSM 5975 / JCM 20966 / LMG 6465 / NBRC 14845 / NCIMB 13405 / ORS 571) TaxID=438753 RepID=A8IJG0_AZOC5|nr:pyridoxamine 5'-phosphate oxidase family protein [Azorhizobium caulinodans]BAF86297.1 pyridoxamine 5'-phosphate oxidase-related protein [Azorhizobium caulinodans ORS 571]
MNVEDVWTAMEERHACMLVDRDGSRLRARPMAPVARRDDGVVWFVTDAHSAKDEEVSAHPEVCLSFSDEGDRFYLSVSGRAEVVRDVAKLKDIWSAPMEAYFPGGPEDPNAVLLRVVPEQAEIWQGDGLLTTGFKMASAILSDRRADLGENAKIEM